MDIKDWVSKQKKKLLELYPTYGTDKSHVNLGCTEPREKNEWSSPNLSR